MSPDIARDKYLQYQAIAPQRYNKLNEVEYHLSEVGDEAKVASQLIGEDAFGLSNYELRNRF